MKWICKKCKDEKELSEFVKCNHCAHGRSQPCKTCFNKLESDRHREKKKARQEFYDNFL
jgi:hypothetical protein